MNKQNQYIVAFDLETTGLNKDYDQIIQFSGIKFDKDTYEIIETKNMYIKPVGNYTIGLGAYFKHGIKPDMLEDKPTFSEVSKEIFEFFNDSDILGYNCLSFDIPFIIKEFARVGIEFSVIGRNVYDAFLEEKRRNGINLENTYKRYKGKSMEEAGLNAHDALSDVKATISVFAAQKKIQDYNPEELFGDDNSISLQEFMGKTVPCFNIGKYKSISVAYVYGFDKSYIEWTLSDKCGFSKTTKEGIKKIIENYG